MKTFVLEPTELGEDKIWYDCAEGFVIMARAETDARTLAASRHGDEGALFWLDPKLSSCFPLTSYKKRGIILEAYRAG